ncbi:MAG: preprotein translocase subunit YajC [Spirochaetales bacterium]|nr:preprotein translocase subunit YajC [Spirochaetales bacterium]
MGAPAGASGASATPQGSMVQIIMIVAVFAVFWLLIIRPQRKRQKEEQKMRESVKKGDKVTSIGGIRGTVKNVLEKTIIIEVDNKGNTLEFTKAAIGSVDSAVQDAAPAKKSKKKDGEESPSEEK